MARQKTVEDLQRESQMAALRAEIAKSNLEKKLANSRSKEFSRLYEAAKTSGQYPRRGSSHSADYAMYQTADHLRNYARWLDENHDLCIGVLDELESRIVGKGLHIEPAAMLRNGELAEDFNEHLAALWKEWTNSRPDASRQYSWTQLQKLIVRTKYRDGELFVQHLEGLNRGLTHTSKIPYSLEFIEPDFCPHEYMRAENLGLNQRRIVQGIEMNQWRQPVGYHMYRQHPNDMALGFTRGNFDTKFVSAEKIMHLKFTRKLHQARGITILHGVMRRLEDIKEYEESERIAARVNAAFTAVITKHQESSVPNALPDTPSGKRQLSMAPGMIFDDLLPGEDVKAIGSERPNTALEPYRKAMMRAVAAGTNTSHSSISKSYDGTYSAQRQELVESIEGYHAEQCILVQTFYEPIYKKFIDMALLSGAIDARNINLDTLYDFVWLGPTIPWIDPKKEAEAQIALVHANIKSRKQAQHAFGVHPKETDKQIMADPLRNTVAVEIPNNEPEEQEDDRSKTAATR